MVMVLIVFGLSVAHAQDFSVGIRTGLANYAGLEFGVQLEPFTIRAVVDGAPFGLGPNTISWLFSLEGLYPVPTDERGSNFYVGVGGGVWLTNIGILVPLVPCPNCPPPSGQLFPQVHAVLGYEWRFDDGFGVALQSSPAMLYFAANSGAIGFLPINLINLRLVYHF